MLTYCLIPWPLFVVTINKMKFYFLENLSFGIWSKYFHDQPNAKLS